MDVNQRSFVEQVREGSLVGPTQRNFSSKRWTRSYTGIESPSISETRLHDAGIWFARKFGEIRNLLERYNDIRIHSDHTIQAHVGAANWMILNDTQIYQDEITASLGGTSEEAEVGEYWPGAYPVMRLHQLVEGLVTSLRFPFSEAIRESRQPLEREASRDIEALTKIRIRIQTGTVYDLLYYLWNECLWNDWYVDTSREDVDAVIPGDTLLELARAIGARRWSELVTETFIRIGIDWRRLTPVERAPFVSMPRVTELAQVGEGERQIITGPGDAESPHAPIQLVTELASTELYFGDLLRDDLPKFPGLTINHLTSAWASLAPLADIVVEQFPELGKVDTLSQVLEYCPTFTRSELHNVLTTAMHVTDSQAAQILDLLTFSDVREELWLRPLVYVDEDKLAVLVSALKAPNLLRSIEQWMKVGGLDLDRKGPAFERFIRERLVQENTLSSFEVVQQPFTLRSEGGEEEIDLVARIGSTVIIGEVKCSIQPTEPMEEHRYFDARLRSGAAQAARKADFVRANFDTFANQAGFTDIREEDARVVPIMLTNLALGVGHSFYDVPVVDLWILRRFIAEGMVINDAVLDQNGNFVEGREEQLYTSEEEAEAVLKGYLANPPQLTRYKAQLSPEPMPITPMSEDDKPAVFIDWISART